MRDMLLGQRTMFSEFGKDEGIATNILNDRLERLVCCGVVVQRPHPSDGRKRVYLPTEAGLALIPLLLELVVWGAAHTSVSTEQANEMAAWIKNDKQGAIDEIELRVRRLIAGHEN